MKSRLSPQNSTPLREHCLLQGNFNTLIISLLETASIRSPQTVAQFKVVHLNKIENNANCIYRSVLHKTSDSKDEKNKILFLSFLVMLAPFRHKLFIITYLQDPHRPFYLSLNILKYFYLWKFSKLHFVGDNCCKMFGLLCLSILLGAYINKAREGHHILRTQARS